MSDDWPSHTAELSRKVSDTIATLAHQHAEGEITSKEMILALGVIWDCCAGMIEEDLMELVGQARAELMGDH